MHTYQSLTRQLAHEKNPFRRRQLLRKRAAIAKQLAYRDYLRKAKPLLAELAQ